MPETYKSQIAAEDLKLWDGGARTFTRKTSTGGLVTLSKVGSVVDVAASWGGTSEAALSAAIAALAGNDGGLLLQPGSWTITGALTIPANVCLVIPAGCRLTKGGGGSITFLGSVEAGAYQIFSGFAAGEVTGIRNPDPRWFGAVCDKAIDNTAAVQLALDAATSGSFVTIAYGCKWNVNSITQPAEVHILDFSGYEVDGTDIWTGQVKMYLNTAAPGTKNAHEFIVAAPYHPAIIVDNRGSTAGKQSSYLFRRNGDAYWQISDDPWNDGTVRMDIRKLRDLNGNPQDRTLISFGGDQKIGFHVGANDIDATNTYEFDGGGKILALVGSSGGELFKIGKKNDETKQVYLYVDNATGNLYLLDANQANIALFGQNKAVRFFGSAQIDGNVVGSSTASPVIAVDAVNTTGNGRTSLFAMRRNGSSYWGIVDDPNGDGTVRMDMRKYKKLDGTAEDRVLISFGGDGKIGFGIAADNITAGCRFNFVTTGQDNILLLYEDQTVRAVSTIQADAGFINGDAGPRWAKNAGSPEGVVTARPGSLCSDTTNGDLYVKNSGTGTTGWKLATIAP